MSALKQDFDSHLFLLLYAASLYERRSWLHRTPSVLGLLLHGSCCSLELKSHRSSGSAVVWDLCHSGSLNFALSSHPSHQSVLLLLCPYIAHSPLSKILEEKGKENRSHIYDHQTSLKLTYDEDQTKFTAQNLFIYLYWKKKNQSTDNTFENKQQCVGKAHIKFYLTVLSHQGWEGPSCSYSSLSSKAENCSLAGG